MRYMQLFLVFFLVGCTGESQQPAGKSNQLNTSYKTEEMNYKPDKETIPPANPTNTDNNQKQIRRKQVSSPRAQKVVLEVPIIEQKPELKYGCEVTSLAMLLQYAGIKVGKMELAKQLPKDNDPISKSKSGDIVKWGNPDHGFVGDVTGKRMGYAINAKPLQPLMNRYLPNRTINLTGQPFEKLLDQIRNKKPVIVWTTGDFKSPDRWESWSHGSESIKTPLDLHVVVLTGFDPVNVYVNDPLSGGKNQRVAKQTFIRSWTALGKQALSYR